MHDTICVLKFGGTSVGNGERIRQVAAIITQTLQEYSASGELFPVVVTSAMSGVTDQLLRIARLTCSGEYEACDQELKQLHLKHREADSIVARDSHALATLEKDLEQGFASLERDVAALRAAT